MLDAARYGYVILVYGSSFSADQHDVKVKELNQIAPGILVHRFDRPAVKQVRTAQSVFRECRSNLYWPLSTLAGESLSE